MSLPDSALSLAERDVREAEERVAMQAEIVRGLDEAGHGLAAREAEVSLAIIRTTLEIARVTLSVARLIPDGEPDA